MDSPSRRQVLAIGAATVTLPMLQSAVGAMRSASATATVNPAAGGAAGRNAPAEKPGWFTTKLKVTDLKDNEFAAVEGHAITISRSGGTILALSTKCTHQGCNIPPKAGTKLLVCPCHGANFNLDGTVAKAPAKNPLAHNAIRVNADGLIEIDPGSTPKPDEKDGSLKADAAAPATAPAK